MKNWVAMIVMLTAVILMTAQPTLAHHSSAAFDLEHPTTVKGTVTKFEWSNPHAFIYIDAKGKNGAIEPWRVEANSPNMLTRVGWKRDMINKGDEVSVTGAPAKNGTKVMRLESVMLANGHKLDGQGFSYGH
jgi:hypothetical protein